MQKRINNNGFEHDHEKNENGKVIIEMTVKDDSAFLSLYSEKDSPIISEEVAAFLENTTQSIMPKEALALKIHSDCIDEEEQVLYIEAISNYYNNKLGHIKRELYRSRIIGLILSLMGIITIVISQILLNKFNTIVWTEVIDIAAWVFLWEAVDIFVFKTRTMHLEQKRYLAFINMDISYCPLSNK